MARPGGELPEAWADGLVKVGTAVPMHTVLRPRSWEDLVWKKPLRLELEGGIPRDRMLPCPVGHYFLKEEERETCHGTDGPCLWPKLKEKGGTTEMVLPLVFDRRGPLDIYESLRRRRFGSCKAVQSPT